MQRDWEMSLDLSTPAAIPTAILKSSRQMKTNALLYMRKEISPEAKSYVTTISSLSKWILQNVYDVDVALLNVEAI